MPEIKDYIYYGVSLLGMIVTGIFSYLLWQANKKSNEISERLMKIESDRKKEEELYKETKSNLYFQQVVSKSNKMVKILDHIEEIIQKRLEAPGFKKLKPVNFDVKKEGPSFIPYLEEEISKILNSKEIRLIEQLNNIFKNIYETYNHGSIAEKDKLKNCLKDIRITKRKINDNLSEFIQSMETNHFKN